MKFIQVPDGDLVSINQIICFNRERLCVWGRTVPINDQVYESLRQHIAVLNPDDPTCAACGSPELEAGTAGCKDYAEDVVGLREAILQHVFIPPIPSKKL